MFFILNSSARDLKLVARVDWCNCIHQSIPNLNTTTITTNMYKCQNALNWHFDYLLDTDCNMMCGEQEIVQLEFVKLLVKNILYLCFHFWYFFHFKLLSPRFCQVDNCLRSLICEYLLQMLILGSVPNLRL